MFGDFKRNQMESVARRYLEGEKGTAILSILTEMERVLNEEIRDQHEALGIETIEQLPSKEDRAEEIRQVALAHLNGQFPEHVVKTYLGDRLENVEEAAQFADLDEEEWQETKEDWAENYEEMGTEGTVDELARAHVRTRYGVDLEEFYHLVVHWPEGRAGSEMESIIASGVRTAQNGIQRTTAVVEAADIEIEESDLEDQDVVLSDP